MQGVTRLVKGLLVLSIPLVLTSCGGGGQPAAASPTQVQVAAVVTLTHTDCTLAPAASPVKAGLVAFTLQNQTGDRAGIDIWAMPDDKTFDLLVAAAAEDRRLAESGEPSQGDHAALGDAPQLRLPWSDATSQTRSAMLERGSYAVVCIKSYPKVAGPRLLKVIGPVVIGPATT